MDELDLSIRDLVYRRFVEENRALAPSEAARELGVDSGKAADAYRRLHDAHALVLEPGDPTQIRMLNPFSTIETPHRVQAGDRAWYGNCAWDALGIPAALHADGIVESRCEDCHEPVRLEVRDGALVRGADLIVHVLVPARHWWDDIVFT